MSQILKSSAHITLGKRVRLLRGAFVFLVLLPLLAACQSTTPQPDRTGLTADAQWTAEKANSWYAAQPWLLGANYIPSTAINPLEMWQAETFDPQSIDRELGWAQSIGFNTVRVFLHNLPYQQDPSGFTNRIDQYLSIADRHHIRTMLVLLDDVWDPAPKLGKQRDPKPHVHNSGWVQAPGKNILGNPSRHDELEPYIKGILQRFGNDPRVVIWDLYNEPGNPNVSAYGPVELKDKDKYSLMLLKKVVTWAREVRPSQPLTVGGWNGDWQHPERLTDLQQYELQVSDVISYHCYDPLPKMQAAVTLMKSFGRPVICTEYMARPIGSTFATHLPYLKEQHVGAYNWGFVEGKSQTNYPWDSWEKTYTAEPPLWFHDIFRTNGTPYNEAEVRLIKTLAPQPHASLGVSLPMAVAHKL